MTEEGGGWDSRHRKRVHSMVNLIVDLHAVLISEADQQVKLVPQQTLFPLQRLHPCQMETPARTPGNPPLTRHRGPSRENTQ